ncbi:uncharacterized protein J3R85_000566 [Psidium guajava]|nr:uncharacterized protein J3R85_000566 [Psidium guajava]
MRDTVRQIGRIATAMLHAFNEERRLLTIPRPQSASTTTPIGSHMDDQPQTSQSIRRSSRALQDTNTIPYPAVYNMADFTPGFNPKFGKTDFTSGFSQFASPYHGGFRPHTPTFSLIAGGFELPSFSQYASTPYVSSEHEMFVQFDDVSQPRLSKEDIPSPSIQFTQAKSRRQYNTRPAEHWRQPTCGTRGHIEGRHHR